MQPHAELDPGSGEIVITTDFVHRYLIRQLPGANYDGDLPNARGESGAWHCPLSWAACLTLRGLFGPEMAVGHNLSAWAWAEYTSRIRPAMALRDALDPGAVSELEEADLDLLRTLDDVERGQSRQLFGYQRADVLYLAVVRRGILANVMGLGKTASAIRTLQVLEQAGEKPYPALVVCPNSLKGTWADEFAKFAPEIPVAVISGSAVKRRKLLAGPEPVKILHWEALRMHSRLAGYGPMALSEEEKRPKELNQGDFRTVIGDEAHSIVHPKAKQTRAFWAVIRQAEYRWCMTGTPVSDNAGDLWSLLHAIEPQGFPGKTRYLDRWCQVELGFFGGTEVLGLNPATAGEFYAITRPLMRRIPKELALPQLPPKLDPVYRYTEMTAGQKKLYRQFEQDAMAMVGDKLISARGALAKLTRLLQLASADADAYTETARNTETGEDEEVTRIRLKAPSSKVNDLVELLAEMGDEALVVMAVSKQLINLAAQRLEKEGISYGLITGDQDPGERDVAKNSFQDGQIRVLLLTIGLGGLGLTLTRSRTLLFMQEDWSKIKNDQAEDRLHRIGQRYPVQIIKQIAPDTVEYRKIEVLGEKKGRIEEVIRDREALGRLLGVSSVRPG